MLRISSLNFLVSMSSSMMFHGLVVLEAAICLGRIWICSSQFLARGKNRSLRLS
ncbi:hypothetical protein DAI22_08g203000 [Oryza sativa Japonica Group]|nr:hypothetical protein DAI22_08g203000 [Oryza sativa Japonica Group]